MASVNPVRLAVLQMLDDQVLVAHTRNGNLEAFETLVERHRDALDGFLVRRTGDYELAQDLTQETFLDAFQHLVYFNPNRPFVAWLYGIAHRRLHHHWRRQRLRHAVSLDWLSSSTAVPPPILWQHDETKSCQERDMLNLVVKELNPPLREVLLLSCLEGFTAVEIADILGISRSAAERRLSRAKEQFRTRYRQLSGEELR